MSCGWPTRSKATRDIVEAQALGVAGDARLEVDERGFRLAGAAGRCLGRGGDRQLARRERQLGGDLAGEARAAFQIVEAAVDRIDVGAAGRAAHDGLEADAAVGFGRRRWRCARRGRHPAIWSMPLNANGPSIEFRLQLAVQAVELGKADALGAVEGDDAVDDLDRLQRDARRHERQRARGDGEAAPVAAALGVDGEAQHRLLEHDLVGLDDALEQRRHRKRMVKLSARKNGSPVVPVGSAMRSFSKLT